MKNDEIKQANRKALPKFLLFAVVCTIVGGMVKKLKLEDE